MTVAREYCLGVKFQRWQLKFRAKVADSKLTKEGQEVLDDSQVGCIRSLFSILSNQLMSSNEGTESISN